MFSGELIFDAMFEPNILKTLLHSVWLYIPKNHSFKLNF